MKENNFSMDKKIYYSTYYDITRFPVSKYFDLNSQNVRKFLVNEI